MCTRIYTRTSFYFLRFTHSNIFHIHTDVNKSR